MLDHTQAFERLGTLGVSRWDTSPPESGIIRWFNAANEEVARGRYAVILSVGPGPKYTMGHAIAAYATLGIPAVEDVDGGPAVVDRFTADGPVWERAEAIGTTVGADFVYQCSTLLVAVFDYTESGAET